MSGTSGRKALLVLGGHGVGAALGYVVLLLIGRYIDPQAYGAYLFALNFVGLVAVFLNLGLGAAHQRNIAMGVPVGQALGVILRLRALLAAGLVVLVSLLWLLFGDTAQRLLTDATTPALLLAAIGLQALSGSRQLLFDTWSGQQRFNRVEIVRFLDTVLSAAAIAQVALAVAAANGRWTPLPGLGAFWAQRLGFEGPPSLQTAALGLAGAYLLGKATSLLVGAAWMARDKVRIGPWDPVLARTYLRFGLPVVVTAALGLVLASTDTLMLGFFYTALEVGQYGAAQKLAVLMAIFGTTAAAILFPRLAQLQAQGDHARAGATVHKAERYLLSVMAPIAAVLVALPEEVLHIAVGDRYLAAAPALRWLTLAGLVAAWMQPVANRLLAAGHLRVLVRGSVLNAGLNVLLNLVLIPEGFGLGLGMTGAAVATCASNLVARLYLGWEANRSFQSRAAPRDALTVLVAVLPIGLGLALAALRWPQAFDRIWELAGWSLLAAAAFAGLLAVLGGVRADDRAYLRRAAHPGALLAELRGR